MKKSFKVIVVDDHDIVLSGLEVLLHSIDGYEVELTEATSYKELKKALSIQQYDLLILDLNLGDRRGVEMIRDISDTYPILPILVLSMYPEEPFALQAIQNGALGYINKCHVKNQFILAVKTILEGGIYLSKEYRDSLPYGTKLEKTEVLSIDKLSKRESEIFYLLAKDLTLKDIADSLDISYKTVYTYTTRILDKLSLTNRDELIEFIKLQKLQTTPPHQTLKTSSKIYL